MPQSRFERERERERERPYSSSGGFLSHGGNPPCIIPPASKWGFFPWKVAPHHPASTWIWSLRPHLAWSRGGLDQKKRFPNTKKMGENFMTPRPKNCNVHGVYDVVRYYYVIVADIQINIKVLAVSRYQVSVCSEWPLDNVKTMSGLWRHWWAPGKKLEWPNPRYHETMSMDWFKGKFTGNHRFSH